MSETLSESNLPPSTVSYLKEQELITLRAENERLNKNLDDLACETLENNGKLANQIDSLRAELAQCRGERDGIIQMADHDRAQAKLVIQRLEAERDTLKGEVAGLREQVQRQREQIQRHPEHVCGSDENCGACIECALMAQGAELERVSQQLTSHRLLLDEMGKALRIAHDAMVTWFSSEYADSEKAKIVRRALDNYYATLTKYQQQCGEKV